MKYSWNNYAYFYVGIYISGNNRGSQPALNAQWVSDVDEIAGPGTGEGFGFIPIDVGWQAPAGCGAENYNRMDADPSTAHRQGIDQAVAAAAAARVLGFANPSPIYVDIEGYDTTNAVCKTAVLEFLRGWLIQMSQFEGRRTGAYGSSSGSDVSSWSTISPPPENVWIAEFNAPDEQSPNISVWRTAVPTDKWAIQPPYGRIHQFRNIPNVWFGDVFLPVDQNCAWGRVAGRGHTADARYPNCPGSPP